MVHMRERQTAATLQHILSLAHPAQGLGEPNPWRGKHPSQPGRLQTSLPSFAAQMPQAAASSPEIRGCSSQAARRWGRGCAGPVGHPRVTWGQVEPARWAGRTQQLLSPTFWYRAPGDLAQEAL